MATMMAARFEKNGSYPLGRDGGARASARGSRVKLRRT